MAPSIDTAEDPIAPADKAIAAEASYPNPPRF